jgi:hypothetical protein
MTLNEAIEKYLSDGWKAYMIAMDIDYVVEALLILKRHNLAEQINDKQHIK